jgi:arginase
VFLGITPGTEFEQATIEQRGLAVVGVDALGADPAGAASQALAALAGCDAVAVHFDVDLVHFLDAPLAENTEREGVTLEVAATALGVLTADPRFRALTVTEHNPFHGAADGSTTRRLVEVLARALS